MAPDGPFKTTLRTIGLCFVSYRIFTGTDLASRCSWLGKSIISTDSTAIFGNWMDIPEISSNVVKSAFDLGPEAQLSTLIT